MSKENYQDDIFILRVQNWQTADKYAVCFSRQHGRVPFIAYGARYPKNVNGRLVQPFAKLHVEFTPGVRFDTLRSCENISLPLSMDISFLAYGAVIAEAVEKLTEDHAPQEEIYELLLVAFAALHKHNKRLVTLSALCKLLALCGFAPELEHCTSCQEPVVADGYFSLPQGGFLCHECSAGNEMPCSLATKELLEALQALDLQNPTPFKVTGKNLMELEKIISNFITYQIEAPLKSLAFLAQL